MSLFYVPRRPPTRLVHPRPRSGRRRPTARRRWTSAAQTVWRLTLSRRKHHESSTRRQACTGYRAPFECQRLDPNLARACDTQHVPSQLLFDSVPDGQRSDVARCRERAARSHSPQGACRERLRARGAPGRRRRLRGGSAGHLSNRSKALARALFAARVRGSSVYFLYQADLDSAQQAATVDIRHS